MAAAVLKPLSEVGAAIHMVSHAFGKITLFFAAGAIYVAAKKTEIHQLHGIGRRMPWTMAAFTLGALGMIGVPPLAGFVSKWYLGTGAMAAGQDWILLVLVVSSVLNAVYFLPILYAAWFKEAEGAWPEELARGRLETRWLLLLPPLVTALLVLAVGLLASTPYSPLEWARLITEREYGP